MARRRLPSRPAVLLAACALGGCGGSPAGVPGPSALRSDERVALYAGYGRPGRDGTVWLIDVEGVVYEPERDSVVRRALVGLVEQALEGGAGAEEERLAEARLRPFLVDHERGKAVTLGVCGRRVTLGPSAHDGRFGGTIVLGAAEVDAAATRGADGTRRLAIEVESPRAREPVVRQVPLLEPTGLTVVSDLDDTIKVSGVGDAKELVANALFRPYRAVEGMPELYARWAAAGARFHYVSLSPLPLHDPLEAFLSGAGFPPGPLVLAPFRVWDGSAFDRLFGSDEHKLGSVGRLVEQLPGRRYVLVGDGAGSDPEVYAELARRFPASVARVYLRDPGPGGGELGARVARAFAALPAERVRVFRSPGEIAGDLPLHDEAP